MAELPFIALAATAASTVVSAIGTIASGNAEADLAMKTADARNKSAQFEARQLDIQAKDEFASGQREAQQLKRQKTLALSNLQAQGAASGFSATDPSNLAIADEIEKYGSVQEGMALYGGSARAQNLNLNAEARRFSGASEVSLASDYASNRRKAAKMSAFGTILGGASTMASRFGGSMSPATTGRYSGGFTPYQRPGGPLVTSRYGGG